METLILVLAVLTVIYLALGLFFSLFASGAQGKPIRGWKQRALFALTWGRFVWAAVRNTIQE